MMQQRLQVGAVQSTGRRAGQAQIIRPFLGRAVAAAAAAVARLAAKMGAGELAMANTAPRLPGKQLPGGPRWPQ